MLARVHVHRETGIKKRWGQAPTLQLLRFYCHISAKSRLCASNRPTPMPCAACMNFVHTGGPPPEGGGNVPPPSAKRPREGGEEIPTPKYDPMEGEKNIPHPCDISQGWGNHTKSKPYKTHNSRPARPKPQSPKTRRGSGGSARAEPSQRAPPPSIEITRSP